MLAELWACRTPDEATRLLESPKPIILQNYIADGYVTAESTAYIDTFNPQTGKLLGKIPNTQAEEVETAIRAAKDAFPAWSTTSRAERSRYLRRISELIEENRELFAVWESIDQGKTLARARVEVDRAVSNFA